MIFPKIQFKTTHFSPDHALEAYAEEKFASLAKHLGHHEDTTCHVEFERLTTQKTGDVCRTEVTLFAHGKSFRAESIEPTFESAIDSVRKALESELAHAHQKHDTLIRRGRRKVKEWLQFGGM